MDEERFREVAAGIGIDAATAEDHNLAVEWMIFQADRAKSDRRAFFDFVMRAEKTRLPIACAPHQRVVFDFIEAHRYCVLRLPVGTSKTTICGSIGLHLLGSNPASRGAIISATQLQAMKPLSMMADYIGHDPGGSDGSAELRMVFPHLRRSPRKVDSWSQSELTVDRPAGIRDASVVAVGVDGALAGARLDWLIIDDILNDENTRTKESCTKIAHWVGNTVLPRVEPEDGRVIVCNTPWSTLDITYALEKPLPDGPAWPSLTMDVDGNIFLLNCDDFDTPDIRPSMRAGEVYRLAANDPDPFETRPLWEARYSAAKIAELASKTLPHHFNMLYRCIVRDDETARCKTSWIQQCKESGKGLGVAYPSTYSGNNPTFTGVDLAVGQGKRNDLTALFTFEQLPDGKRKVLDIDIGQWDAPTIVDKVLEKTRRFKSIARVESNAAQQYLIQFIRQRNASAPIKSHVTGMNKVDPRFGIEGLFLELQNNAWIIPCDAAGRVHRNTQRWIDDCTGYDPTKHTGDTLIASWLAREQARDMGYVAGERVLDEKSNPLKGLAARLLAR